MTLVVVGAAGCGDNGEITGDAQATDTGLPDTAAADTAMADAPPDAGVGHVVGAGHDFGLIEVAKLATATITLTNPTADIAPIDSIAVTGAGFSRGATTCGATLAAGQSCDVTVNAAPFHLGSFSGQLAVETAGTTTMIPLSAVAGRKLGVRLAGTGTGEVTSNAGIDCGSTCTTLQATTIMLTAAPTGTSRFAGWSGAPGCGAMPVCLVDPQIPPREIAAVFLMPGDLALTVVMAGNAPSEVQVRTLSTNDGCIDNCVVGIPAGVQVDISAASPSTYAGMSGACATTQHTCSVTLAADATLTVTSNREPNETFSRFAPFGFGGTVSFGTDAQGNLFLGGPVKVDPAGNVLWALPLGGVVAVSADGHVAVWGNTMVSLVAPDGTTQWSVDVGESFSNFDFNRQPLAISSDADTIVVKLQSSIRVYAGNGTLRWSATQVNPPAGVAVDQQNTVTVVRDDDLGVDRALIRYAPDGTPLTPVDNIAGIDGIAGFDLDASGAPVTTVIDQQLRAFIRRRLDGTLVFELHFTDPRAFTEGSSVAVASDDTLWWGYDPDGNATEYALEHRNADGTLQSALTRGNIQGDGTTVGPYIFGIHRGGAAGSVVVGGTYQGYLTSAGFVQGFTP